MSFVEFKDLGDDVWLYEPRDSEEGSDSNDNNPPAESIEGPHRNGREGQPALIILCTWLGGATKRRIETYTRGYQNLWPCSSILLIRTNMREYLFQSTTSLRRKLHPARREIRRLGLENKHQDRASSLPEEGNILLHIFSQGGSNMATQLLESTNAILSTLGHQGPLPLRQIVLDSCPGDPDIQSSCAAGAHSFPDASLLRVLCGAVLYVFVTGLAGMEAVGLKESLARTMSSQLNDPEVFSARASRLYLTSEADKIIHSRDVEEHRNQAVAKGFTTDILRFRRAGHCSLVLEDDAAYWSAIASGWERSAGPRNEQIIEHPGDSGVLYPPFALPATTNRFRSRL